MLDWIFEGIVSWVGRTVTQLMDAVSGLFLNALGTDMTAMDEYFPFASQAFTILQYTSWTILFLVTVWKTFRAFGGPVTEAEHPITLLARSAVFALLIWFAKPIFLFVLDIARAPYTALMDVSMGKETFTFAGIESVLRSGLISFVSFSTVVGSLLLIILMIALGWNYFKLLLEVVERYVVVGVLCYTSPLAYSMGASKDTNPVFKSWCRMVGSQLLLLVMNVWFLRAFNSSVGRYIATGGALSNGHGSVFLWLFCALAFLKVAQRFDSYLASIGLNVAQTGTGLGMELLIASRILMGGVVGFRNAGSVFSGGGGLGGADGRETSLNLYNASQFEKPNTPHSVVSASDGSKWYQTASGAGAGAFYDAPNFTGSPGESAQVAAAFPNAEPGTRLRSVDAGVLESNGPSGNSLWYNSAYFNEPKAPHTVIQSSDGVDWYAMQPHSESPTFEIGDAATEYNCARFREFMPGYENAVSRVDGTYSQDGHFEVRHADGSGTAFYDSSRYDVPRGEYQSYEDAGGNQWYAIRGEAAVERRPVYEDGKPVYDGDSVRTVSVETVHYRSTPSKFEEPRARGESEPQAPKRK